MQAERHPEPSTGGIYEKFTMDCSLLCIQSAIDLISLIHETCNTDLASVWFYNVFCKDSSWALLIISSDAIADVFTAGSITLLAELHQPVVDIVTREALELSWTKCQATLEHLKPYSIVADRCANSMKTIRSKCLTSISGKEIVWLT
jgi:hypothetical protein